MSASPPANRGKINKAVKRKKSPNGIAWYFSINWPEIAGEYLRKGQQVYIEGSLRTRKWQGQDGQDRYTTEIIASDMQMLGSRNNSGMGAGSYDEPMMPAKPMQAHIMPRTRILQWAAVWQVVTRSKLAVILKTSTTIFRFNALY